MTEKELETQNRIARIAADIATNPHTTNAEFASIWGCSSKWIYKIRRSIQIDFGGEIYRRGRLIAIMTKEERANRDKVIQDFAARYPNVLQRQIAQRFHLSQQQVQRILAKSPDDARA